MTELSEERRKDHELQIEKAIEAENTRSNAINNMVAPNENKNIRQPVDANPRQVEKEYGTALPLEDGGEMNYMAEYYAARHKDKQLFWQNDSDSSLQRWLDRGAEPVKVETRGRREFAGLTVKKGDSSWVVIHGTGMIDGNPINTYLFMIDPEAWDRYKLEPDRKRNAAIQDRLRRGHTDDGEPALKTYAPMLDSLPGHTEPGAVGLGENKTTLS